MANEDLIKKIKDFIPKIDDEYNRIKNWRSSVLEPNKETFVSWMKSVKPDLLNPEKELDDLAVRLSKTDEIRNRILIIDSEINDKCNWSKNYLNLLYNTISQCSLSFLMQYLFDVNLLNDAASNQVVKHDVVNRVLRLRDESLGMDFIQKEHAIRYLDNFSIFRRLDKNFVIVGANGSGKSSFSRRTRQILDSSVAIISSQKVFLFRPIENLPFGNKWRNELINYQSRDKLHKGEERDNQIVNELIVVTNALFEEENQFAHEYYHGVATERKASTLEQVVSLWGKILKHRSLKTKDGNISVLTEDGNEYPFMQLSDGEKAVFYYIAYIMFAKENSYIIVDEPENHLHLALIMKLWDALELARPDCQFIYLTHNLEFAASRNNAEKIWMKNFIAPDKWEMEKIPNDKDLPEILYMELLGSRKPILFCEGTKASLDYKLYTRLFPNYTVIPVDGHLQVVSYTKAFNNSNSIHHNRAIGIIDGDFHKDEQKEAWKKDNIYCLDVQEVENVLCDENLLNRAVDCFNANQDSLEKAKDKLFTELQRHIDSQCAEYTVQMINNRFKENMLRNPKDLETLKNSVKELAGKMLENVDAFVDERKACLQKIIDTRDFAEGIKRFNNKGLIAILTTDIEKDYRNRVFKMLDKNPDLLDTLKNKYFADIPQNL